MIRRRFLKTLVIVNPNSANGRTGKNWPEIRSSLRYAIGEFEDKSTSGQGHATELARDGLRAGAERIISVGGDGTNNEVVNGFFDGDQPINPEACLGFVPRGTGGDLRKTLGIGRERSRWQAVLAAGHTRKADLGSCEYVDHAGQPARRLFINITSFGIGGLVDAKVNQSTKIFGGRVSFMIGMLRALAIYRNRSIRLTVKNSDGSIVMDESMRINNVAVANGQYFGGGMWIAPRAEIDDGLFDVVIMGDLSKAGMLLKSSNLYRGTHLGTSKIRSCRGSLVEATSNSEVLIDMDGEQPGRLPIKLIVLPGAIRLIAPMAYSCGAQTGIV